MTRLIQEMNILISIKQQMTQKMYLYCGLVVDNLK